MRYQTVLFGGALPLGGDAAAVGGADRALPHHDGVSEVDNPLLDVRVFRYWPFTNSLLLISVLSVGLFTVLFYVPLYLQQAAGLGAFESGLLLLPQALIMAVLMPIAGRLYDKIGMRWLLHHDGPGASNHFEGGGFVRTNDRVTRPNLMIHFLPVAIDHDGNRPTGFILPVRGLVPSAGAEFVVALCGEMQRMPGLGKAPAFMNIDIDAEGRTVGLY